MTRDHRTRSTPPRKTTPPEIVADQESVSAPSITVLQRAIGNQAVVQQLRARSAGRQLTVQRNGDDDDDGGLPSFGDGAAKGSNIQPLDESQILEHLAFVRAPQPTESLNQYLSRCLPAINNKWWVPQDAFDHHRDLYAKHARRRIIPLEDSEISALLETVQPAPTVRLSNYLDQIKDSLDKPTEIQDAVWKSNKLRLKSAAKQRHFSSEIRQFQEAYARARFFHTTKAVHLVAIRQAGLLTEKGGTGGETNTVHELSQNRMHLGREETVIMSNRAAGMPETQLQQYKALRVFLDKQTAGEPILIPPEVPGVSLAAAAFVARASKEKLVQDPHDSTGKNSFTIGKNIPPQQIAFGTNRDLIDADQVPGNAAAILQAIGSHMEPTPPPERLRSLLIEAVKGGYITD
jgi:hypothetical protein